MKKSNTKNLQSDNRGTKCRKSHSLGQKRRMAIENCERVTDLLCDELLDGHLLSLSAHNQEKSLGEQKRIMRRIVEKRQAQVSRAIYGRTTDLLAAKMWRRSHNHCIYVMTRQMRGWNAA